MRKIILLAFLIPLLLSCEDNDINKSPELIPGTYTGQFNRSNLEVNYAPSNVTLTFTADRFSGESDQVKYPAICNGTYKITGQEIEFTNDCAWTADFDWTYILSGKFNLKVENGKLEMTKHANGQTDRYLLTLQ